MDKNIFEQILQSAGRFNKADIIKEKKYDVKDINLVFKLVERIKNDLLEVGIKEEDDKNLCSNLYYAFMRGKDDTNVKKINFTLYTEHSFERKGSIDQRPNKIRNLSYLNNSIIYAVDKRSSAKAEREARILRKEIETLNKNFMLFNDSNDFKLIANRILSNETSNKLPSYIEKINIKGVVQPQDHYDDEGKSYIMDVKLLNKKELIEAKKNKNSDEYIQKYNNNYFLIELEEYYSTPKDFDLIIHKDVTINFDKIPQFKNVFKERELNKVENELNR